MKKMLKLDVGCGHRTQLSEFVGIDRCCLPRVDLVLDLEDATLPYQTNEVEEIRASHVLEHIHAFIPVMEELWRVLRPGGRLHIRVPNSDHASSITDPTHVRSFTPSSFNFFDRRKVLFRESGWYSTKARFRIDNKTVTEREIRYSLSAVKLAVLLVAPPLSVHTERWMAYLASWGHEVSVAARSAKGVANITLGVSTLAKEDQLDALNKVGERLAGYDVVHVHFGTVYGRLLSGVRSGRRVLSVWGEDVLTEAAECPRRRRRLEDGLRHAEIITTSSRHMAGHLASTYGVDPGKLWSFPWGYDNEIFGPEDRPADLLELDRLGIPRRGMVLLSARVCVRANNISRLLDSFRAADVDATLVVCTGLRCDDSYLAQLRESADYKVTFVPPLTSTQLAALYRRSEVTLSIPDVDQISTTVLESLACGTPVVCSDIPPCRERVRDGVNGLLVDLTNTDDLVSAIQTACTGQFRESKSAAASASVSGDSWLENAGTMLAAYDVPDREVYR